MNNQEHQFEHAMQDQDAVKAGEAAMEEVMRSYHEQAEAAVTQALDVLAQADKMNNNAWQDASGAAAPGVWPPQQPDSKAKATRGRKQKPQPDPMQQAASILEATRAAVYGFPDAAQAQGGQSPQTQAPEMNIEQATLAAVQGMSGSGPMTQ